jgi:hypothetical protein
LIRRRRETLFGKTLWVRGPKVGAPVLLAQHYEEIVQKLSVAEEVIVVVSAAGAWVDWPRHLREPAPRRHD